MILNRINLSPFCLTILLEYQYALYHVGDKIGDTTKNLAK